MQLDTSNNACSYLLRDRFLETILCVIVCHYLCDSFLVCLKVLCYRLNSSAPTPVLEMFSRCHASWYSAAVKSWNRFTGFIAWSQDLSVTHILYLWDKLIYKSKCWVFIDLRRLMESFASSCYSQCDLFSVAVQKLLFELCRDQEIHSIKN